MGWMSGGRIWGGERAWGVERTVGRDGMRWWGGRVVVGPVVFVIPLSARPSLWARPCYRRSDVSQHSPSPATGSPRLSAGPEGGPSRTGLCEYACVGWEGGGGGHSVVVEVRRRRPRHRCSVVVPVVVSRSSLSSLDRVGNTQTNPATRSPRLFRWSKRRTDAY